MNRILYLVVLGLASLGLMGAYLMVPSKDEIAFIHFKDKHFIKALEFYESRVEQEGLTVANVGPLSKLYLQYGMIKKAILLLERFLRENPANMEARKDLGRLYQYAQRPADYQKNLETIRELEPSQAVLVELSYIYNANELYEKQIDVLSQLVRDFKPLPEDYIKLAYLHAAAHDFDKAVAVMDQLFAATPGLWKSEWVELAVNLLIDLQNPKAAVVRIEEYLKGKDLGERGRMASLLASRNQYAAAKQLLVSFEQEALHLPFLLALLTEVDRNLGQSQQALARLMPILQEDRLPDELLIPLVHLLIEQKQPELYRQVLPRLELELLPDEVLVELALAAIEMKNPLVAGMMKAKLQGNRLEQDPMLNLLVQASLGDDLSQFSSQVQGLSLSDQKRLILTGVFLQRSMAKEARSMLAKVQSLRLVPPEDLLGVANHYLDAKLLRQGLDLVQAYGQAHRKSGPAYQQAAYASSLLLLVGLAAPQALEEIARMEASHLRLLQDLHYTAGRFGAKGHQVAAAQRLYQLEPSKEHEIWLVEAWLAAQDYERVIRQVAPYALAGDKDWIYLYADALEKAKRPSQWKEFWLGYQARPDLGQASRREVAYLLLSKNHQAEAESIFMTLAQGQGAESKDMQELLNLWGQSPPPERVQWFSQSLAQADLQAQLSLLRLIAEAGWLLAYQPAFEPLAQQNQLVMNKLALAEAEGGQVQKGLRRMVLAVAQKGPDLDRGKTLFTLLVKAYPQADPLLGMGQLPLRLGSPKAVLELVQKAAKQKDQALLKLLQQGLGKDYLAAYPFVELSLQVAQGQAVPENQQLDDPKRLALAQLVFYQGQGQLAGELVQKITSLGFVSSEDLPQVTEFLLQARLFEQGERLLQNLVLPSQAQPGLHPISEGRWLMAAALGRPDDLQRATRQEPPLPLALLLKMFDLAEAQRQSQAMQLLSKHLQSISPGALAQGLAARVHLAQKEYGPALRLLAPLAQQDPLRWGWDYNLALAQMGQKEGQKTFWSQAMLHPSFTPDLLRSLAYRLLEGGHQGPAAQIFAQLALEEPPLSQAISELIYLWGPAPPPEALTWLTNRYQKAKQADQPAWIRRMMEVGLHQEAWELLQKTQSQPSREMALLELELLDFLGLEAKREDLALELALSAEKLDELERLIELIKKPAHREQALNRLLSLKPQDNQARIRAGKIAFERGRYKEAFQLLQETQRDLDWQGHFYLGELHSREKRSDQAQQAYRRALELLNQAGPSDLAQRMARAEVLHRLGQRGDSIELYRKIFQESGAEEVRSLLIDRLIEENRLSEAEAMMEKGR